MIYFALFAESFAREYNNIYTIIIQFIVNPFLYLLIGYAIITIVFGIYVTTNFNIQKANILKIFILILFGIYYVLVGLVFVDIDIPYLMNVTNFLSKNYTVFLVMGVVLGLLRKNVRWSW